jgi:hypothetical protein
MSDDGLHMVLGNNADSYVLTSANAGANWTVVSVAGLATGAASGYNPLIAMNAAGNMTQAKPRNPTTAICQFTLVISDCVMGEAKVKPNDPMAETAPMAVPRLAALTVRAVMFMAMLEAVHDSAMPTQNPTPSVTIQVASANLKKTRPMM